MGKIPKATADSIYSYKDGTVVQITALVEECQRVDTKIGNMETAWIDSEKGKIDAIIILGEYMKWQALIKEGTFFTIQGQIDLSDPGCGLRLKVMRMTPFVQKHISLADIGEKLYELTKNWKFANIFSRCPDGNVAMRGNPIVTTDSIFACQDGAEVQLTAALEEIRVKETKRSGKMAVARIDAGKSVIEAIIFPDNYKKWRARLRVGAIFTIQGQIDFPEGAGLKLKVIRMSHPARQISPWAVIRGKLNALMKR